MLKLARFFTVFFAILSFSLISCKEEEGETYPYAMGDIVLSDGSLVHFADRTSITEEQKKKAIGVVFYVYYSEYTDEITNYIKSSSDPKVKNIKALALGLKHQRLTSWAREYTTGYKTNFSDISDSSLKVGITAWEKVYSLLKDSKLTRDDYVYASEDYNQEQPLYKNEWKISKEGNGRFEETNYPAFYFANTYGVKNSLNSLSFAGDFHLPALEEFKMISDNINIVQPSLECTSAGFSLASLGRFWTANQSSTAVNADVYNFSSMRSDSASKSVETQVVAAFVLY